VAPTLAPVHEHLARSLRPARGVRWLDLGTGTGALALVAARAGADVVGLDPASGLIATARRLAAEEGLDVRFDVADTEALPCPDASFEVVSSSMGIAFAPDHGAVARELARVCEPGGRVGFSAWCEGAGFAPVTRRYSPELLPGQGDSLDWSREEYARTLLGAAFELEFESGDAPVVGASGESVWELLVVNVGPFKARAADLPRERFEALHREFVDLLEAHRQGDEIRLPAPYVVILGTRK
jgi:SAM-dependent methyltransferase